MRTLAAMCNHTLQYLTTSITFLSVGSMLSTDTCSGFSLISSNPFVSPLSPPSTISTSSKKTIRRVFFLACFLFYFDHILLYTSWYCFPAFSIWFCVFSSSSFIHSFILVFIPCSLFFIFLWTLPFFWILVPSANPVGHCFSYQII